MHYRKSGYHEIRIIRTMDGMLFKILCHTTKDFDKALEMAKITFRFDGRLQDAFA